MPVVRLPDDLLEYLEHNDSGQISTGGRGVASYATPSGELGAEIYVGLHLDGFHLYENISSVDPTIKMQFSFEPIITCWTSVLAFNPDIDDFVEIRVRIAR